MVEHKKIQRISGVLGRMNIKDPELRAWILGTSSTRGEALTSNQESQNIKEQAADGQLKGVKNSE
ncbi:hypothetical protein ACFL1Q_01785 [Patescibacteria group bacterium]